MVGGGVARDGAATAGRIIPAVVLMRAYLTTISGKTDRWSERDRVSLESDAGPRESE